MKMTLPIQLVQSFYSLDGLRPSFYCGSDGLRPSFVTNYCPFWIAAAAAAAASYELDCLIGIFLKGCHVLYDHSWMKVGCYCFIVIRVIVLSRYESLFSLYKSLFSLYESLFSLYESLFSLYESLFSLYESSKNDWKYDFRWATGSCYAQDTMLEMVNHSICDQRWGRAATVGAWEADGRLMWGAVQLLWVLGKLMGV
jgi:hypothetical protein